MLLVATMEICTCKVRRKKKILLLSYPGPNSSISSRWSLEFSRSSGSTALVGQRYYRQERYYRPSQSGTAASPFRSLVVPSVLELRKLFGKKYAKYQLYRCMVPPERYYRLPLRSKNCTAVAVGIGTVRTVLPPIRSGSTAPLAAVLPPCLLLFLH